MRNVFSFGACADSNTEVAIMLSDNLPHEEHDVEELKSSVKKFLMEYYDIGSEEEIKVNSFKV